jgi:hypothetical protein
MTSGLVIALGAYPAWPFPGGPRRESRRPCLSVGVVLHFGSSWLGCAEDFVVKSCEEPQVTHQDIDRRDYENGECEVRDQ